MHAWGASMNISIHITVSINAAITTTDTLIQYSVCMRIANYMENLLALILLSLFVSEYLL